MRPSLPRRPSPTAVLVLILAAALASALALYLSLTTPSRVAGTAQAPPASRAAQGSPPLTEGRLRREAAALLEAAGAVSVHVRVRDGRHAVAASAGEAELGTGRAVPDGTHFRAASVTKSFMAATVLRLAAERRLSLDDTVEHWLPGVVSGNGHDGNRVTLRHLLQHTSGLRDADSTAFTGRTAPEFERLRYEGVEPERLIAAALRQAPEFPPAAPGDPAPRWSYSNTGYLLLGEVVRKATGRPWEAEVRDRIVRELGLTGTRAPGDDPRLPEPYARTYHRFAGSGGWTDTTVRAMAWAGPAGALVSTSRDVDRFFTALLGGRLLPPPQLAAMRATVPVDAEHERYTPGMRYGLGLMRQPLGCGGHRWGHHGDLEGAMVRTGLTADGSRSVVIALSGRTTDKRRLLATEKALQGLVERMLCRA
ncbi:serine hydrolase domain-containing protein [Streptomyces fradiae]|uniref:serine hydrolase domain-containing protein n=1 Tax=Streptomyces fradiae TaxID=1906 RepID=UPI0037B5D75E